MKLDCALIWCAVSMCLAVASPATAQPDVQYVPVRTSDPAGMLAARWDGLSESPVFLPLKRTDVYLEVLPGLIEATVIQEFRNDTPHSLEAEYIFPLPAQASITDMEMLIGDRTIRSVVQERETARRTYEAAKQQGKKTALLEQERPNIFTSSVANFLPGETLRIAFTYLEPATYDDGCYDIAFPMVIGPRYVPHTTPIAVRPAEEDAERMEPSYLHPRVDPEHRVHLVVDVAGCPVDDIASSTHPIVVRPVADRPGVLRVALRDEMAMPDCDFAATIRLNHSAAPTVSALRSSEDDDEYALISMFPPTEEQAPRPHRRLRDVVFLIDTSGSMNGTSIQQATAGLLECMSMLQPEDRFTIFRFSGDYSGFRPTMAPATPALVEEARSYILSLGADGGTEMQPALAHVLRLPRRDSAMTLVVFMTDGDVGNESELLTLLQSDLGRARLFAFGIGSAPNEFLMRRMAEMGRGQARFIRTEEDVGAVISDFFATLDAPVCTDVELVWIDEQTRAAVDMPSFPSRCPDLFFARPLQVVARLPLGFAGRIELHGLIHGKPVRYVHTLPTSAAHPTSALATLFGRAQVDDLMASWYAAGAAERERLRGEIVEVALAYQLVTQFTSRVAVEEVVARQPDGTLVSTRVPAPVPRGWSMGSTATMDPLLSVIGAMMLGMALVLPAVRLHRGTRS
jgi:Ca-activated chloride channel family protein